MEQFYKEVLKLTDGENITATVIEGELSGHKLLVNNGKIAYSSNDLLTKNLDKILKTKETGLIELENNKIYVEGVMPKREIVICGGGHVAWALIQLGKMLGFYITVIEDREFFIEKCKEKGADNVILGDYEEELQKLETSTSTFFMVVTRGHSFDKICVKNILAKPHAYIGMLGSTKRGNLVRDGLRKEGITECQIADLYSPIGLDIKAETPEEVAVAIYAQVIELKNSGLASEGYTKSIRKGLESEGNKVLAVIVDKNGSAPRERGTKMIINENGDFFGTVGGGACEGKVMKKAEEMIKNNTVREIYEENMDNSEAGKNGMVCGGNVEIYMELL